MPRCALVIVLLFTSIAGVTAQSIPKVLRGRWRVQQMLPADTVTCWDSKEAGQLIGTEIEYTADSFNWKDKLVSHPSVKITEVTAEEFQKEFSGSGSLVDFGRLGIRASKVTKVTIGHPAAHITGGSIEIPGDEVLIKDRSAIVF